MDPYRMNNERHSTNNEYQHLYNEGSSEISDLRHRSSPNMQYPINTSEQSHVGTSHQHQQNLSDNNSNSINNIPNPLSTHSGTTSLNNRYYYQDGQQPIRQTGNFNSSSNYSGRRYNDADYRVGTSFYRQNDVKSSAQHYNGTVSASLQNHLADRNMYLQSNMQNSHVGANESVHAVQNSNVANYRGSASLSTAPIATAPTRQVGADLYVMGAFNTLSQPKNDINMTSNQLRQMSSNTHSLSNHEQAHTNLKTSSTTTTTHGGNVNVQYGSGVLNTNSASLLQCAPNVLQANSGRTHSNSAMPANKVESAKVCHNATSSFSPMKYSQKAVAIENDSVNFKTQLFASAAPNSITKQTITPSSTQFKPNKSPKNIYSSKRIEIPFEFPPRHSYRAAAAYSLLRTLSKVLRLSPFTLQSFCAALMLPIPSKLLGEIHVRVMRVLFANIRMGSYARYGRGEGHLFLERKRCENSSNRDEDGNKELVRTKSCDNLFYLDNLTWPLFFEDYAIVTEEKFLKGMKDEEDYIDLRSLVFVEEDSGSNHSHHPRHTDKTGVLTDAGEELINRCPIGPLGKRNQTTGRFVCCPFHIHAAVSKARQDFPTTSEAAPLRKKRKRSKVPKKYETDDISLMNDSGDDCSDDSDEDYRVTSQKKSKGKGKRGRPRKYPKPGSEPTHQSNNVNSRLATRSDSSLAPIIVPPLPHTKIDLNAMIVPKSTEDIITKYFLEGDLSKSNSDEEGNDQGERRKKIQEEKENINHFETLPHMASIEQLQRGVPYHHLSLEMKLRMIEFLLDELLDIDEIGEEFQLRRTRTSPHDGCALYGEVPNQDAFDGLVNEDECLICGLEGDLLCCDGCPGSFHKVCMGMAPSSKLPEGKWLCTECRVVDGSKMGPLQSECRPLIGWFTLKELDIPEALIHGTNNANSIASRACINVPQAAQHAFTTAIKVATAPELYPNNIPNDVEFLVTTGKVFARYRQSHEKFDPFNSSPRDFKLLNTKTEPLIDGIVSLTQNPPEPLSNAEVIELLKLLGPEICVKLPWRRLVFNPNNIFSISNVESEKKSSSINDLILHYREVRALLANHPDTSNPLEFENKYRKAPPIPQVKQQLGRFVIPTVLPDIFTIAPKVVSQFGLSLTANFLLNRVVSNNQCGMQFQDVTQCLREQLIKLGKSLYDCCLLDHRWEALDNWTLRVRDAKSFFRLSVLLVKLADACSSRAFQKEWYQIKEHDNFAETTRLSHKNNYASIVDGWTENYELKLRSWQRCTNANLFSLLYSEKEVKGFLKNIGTATKRGKKRRSNIVKNINNKTGSPIDENRLVCDDIKRHICSESINFVDGVTTATKKDVTNISAAETESEQKTSLTMKRAASHVTESKESEVCGSLDPSRGLQENTVATEGAETPQPMKKKRCTTRRLSPVPTTEKKRCSDRLNEVRKQIEALLGLNIDVSSRQLDREVHGLQLDTLERLLSVSKDTLFFAIAGMKLFEPEGAISPQHVRRLGRNAGSIRAPFMAYETPFEVGEPATCHWWRKMTLRGNTFENFVFSLKFFKDHIDQSVISSCNSIVNKLSKAEATIQFVIRCERIDQMTGMREYFVVNRVKNQGKWQLEANIDLPPFISYQFQKSRPAREKYNKLQKKLQDEKIAEAIMLAEEKKKAEELRRQEMFAREMARNEKNKAEAQKRVEALLKKMADKNKSIATKTPTSSPQVTKVPAKKSRILPQNAFEAALMTHRDKVFNLLAECAARGEKSVPVDVMLNCRNKTLQQMQTNNAVMKIAHGVCCTHEELKAKMSKAETEAITKYTMHIQRGK